MFFFLLAVVSGFYVVSSVKSRLANEHFGGKSWDSYCMLPKNMAIVDAYKGETGSFTPSAFENACEHFGGKSWGPRCMLPKSMAIVEGWGNKTSFTPSAFENACEHFGGKSWDSYCMLPNEDSVGTPVFSLSVALFFFLLE